MHAGSRLDWLAEVERAEHKAREERKLPLSASVSAMAPMQLMIYCMSHKEREDGKKEEKKGRSVPLSFPETLTCDVLL